MRTVNTTSSEIFGDMRWPGGRRIGPIGTMLRAGLEFYRAYAANERFNAAQRNPIDLPIVLAGGDHATAPLNTTVAQSLRLHGWRNVSVEVIANSGHQVIDEQPASVADLLEQYAAR